MFNTEQEAYKTFRGIVRERTGRLLAWVGSGLSQPAGLPSWSSLRKALCDALVDKASTTVADRKEGDSLIAASVTARKHQSPWVALEILHKHLGNTTFAQAVHDSFRGVHSCSIPVHYLRLWELPVFGLLNLNLDRLATRAYTQKRPGAHFHEFHGQSAGSYAHILKSPVPFIVNLHGVLDDHKSWVLTHADLRRLLANAGYKTFIRTCLVDSTLLFVGISADDVAVGGHLEALRKSGVDCGRHFWLTDRRDPATIAWAEKAGVRLITYSSEHGHKELDAFFDDLLSYVPQEREDTPVSMAVKAATPSPLPSPEQLLRLDPNEARERLNAHASIILKDRTPESYTEFEGFCRRYDRAIHNAWYVSTQEPSNRLFDYTLLEEIAEGAFGRVFRAQDDQGRPLAIKLLKPDIRRKAEMLRSFRRGVASMQILAARGVEGVVSYQSASEIPAFVVMDFIEGPDLRKAVEARYITDWPKVMRLALELTRIIRRAHLLPERVLHRDLRPSNIMLKDFHTNPEGFSVVVLDFDLSWHRGAVEDSVVSEATLNGYLAPEQIEVMPSAYTRNALLDSFGLGMTLFFLRTGSHPHPLQHRQRDWIQHVHGLVEKNACREWKSLPRRYARLITVCTRDRQVERWDMSQVQAELERLHEALQNPESVRSAELWAEEIATLMEIRLGKGTMYTWHQDSMTAEYKFASGVQLRISGDELHKNVQTSLFWASTGEAERRNIAKYLPTKCERVVANLKRAGWHVRERPKPDINTMACEAAVPVSVVLSSAEQAAAALVNMAEEFEFR